VEKEDLKTVGYAIAAIGSFAAMVGMYLVIKARREERKA
jgi:hypothetical protein